MDIYKITEETKEIFHKAEEVLPYSYKNVGELVKNGYFYSFATYDIKNNYIFIIFMKMPEEERPVKYIVLIVLDLFYIVPLTMCWMLYASHIFDKYINKEHYPQIYRKGMRKIEEEENESQKERSLY